jgi:hypothetical protein
MCLAFSHMQEHFLKIVLSLELVYINTSRGFHCGNVYRVPGTSPPPPLCPHPPAASSPLFQTGFRGFHYSVLRGVYAVGFPPADPPARPPPTCMSHYTITLRLSSSL